MRDPRGNPTWVLGDDGRQRPSDHRQRLRWVEGAGESVRATCGRAPGTDVRNARCVTQLPTHSVPMADDRAIVHGDTPQRLSWMIGGVGIPARKGRLTKDNSASWLFLYISV